MTKFVAEDVPAYSVEPGSERPWRDEDLGMSAPIRYGSFDTEDDARKALIAAVAEHVAYYRPKAEIPGSYYRKDFELWSAVEAALTAGVTVIKVHGRYLRVRQAA